MRLAVDTKKTQEIILGVFGLPAQHDHVSPIHPEHADISMMGRDLVAARKLLAEAGYPDGIDLGQLDCKSAPSWEFNTVQALVEQWKDAGIRCKINLMPSPEFWKIWDKTTFGFTEWAHRPLGVMALSLAYRTGVPWNESDYANPELDRLLTEAEGILDIDQRREVMARIQTIMQKDGPIVQPIWRSVMTVMHKRVKGFSMHPTRYIFGNELALER
jgi:peptide/nickel transport system substrate-binding protein